MTAAVAYLPVSSTAEFASEDDGMYEIVNGKRVEKEMGSLSTKTAGVIIREVGNFLKASGVGDLYIEQSYECFPHIPGQMRRPDISFIATHRTVDIPEEGHILIAPDLAIEIVSPNDKVYELDEKLVDYKSAGVKIVWVINPSTRIVRVHGPGHAYSELEETETLTAESVLPGFSILVKDLLPPRKQI